MSNLPPAPTSLLIAFLIIEKREAPCEQSEQRNKRYGYQPWKHAADPTLCAPEVY